METQQWIPETEVPTWVALGKSALGTDPLQLLLNMERKAKVCDDFSP